MNSFFLLQVAFLLFINVLVAQNQLNFGEVVTLVREIETPIILEKESSKILVSSNQSQVITSSVNGDTGYSYGWLDKDAIEKNKMDRTTFFYGGEDRLWLNPLGTKFSLFYNQKEIKPENWKVPTFFEAEKFTRKKETSHSVLFEKQATIINNIGSEFSIGIKREITLLSKKEVKDLLKLRSIKSVNLVGFSSRTKITNVGKDWRLEKGLITPWVLGMFKGTPSSIGIFPYSEEKTPLELYKYLTVFGKERVVAKGGIVYFKTDGNHRSKIGLGVANSLAMLGNYDYKNQRLTIIQFNFQEKGNYLGSIENEEANQFGGDVVSSYNNSANDNSIPTFFELETTAPARALQTNESIEHIHTTFHFEGTFEQLNEISKQVLGCDLINVEKSF